MNEIHEDNIILRRKYRLTSVFYDILDYYWERQYRRWRPKILGDVHGTVLEAGVGTGRNFEYYPRDVHLIGVDLSDEMLRHARQRAKGAECRVELMQGDATSLKEIAAGSLDWYISTFLFCVMPDNLHPLAIRQMARVLKPGGRFRAVEMLYSKDPKLFKRQKFFAPFVEKVYGARFDHGTLEHLKKNRDIKITNTSFLKADTYLLIEGQRR